MLDAVAEVGGGGAGEPHPEHREGGGTQAVDQVRAEVDAEDRGDGVAGDLEAAVQAGLGAAQMVEAAVRDVPPRPSG